MKRFSLLISYTLFFTLITSAQPSQPAKISWGEELEEPSNSEIWKVITNGSKGFYAVRLKSGSAVNNEQVILEYYDSNLKLQRAQEFGLKYKGKDRDFEDIVKVSGQLYLLTSYHNQSQKKNYLFYQKISPRLALSKTLVNIGEIETRNKTREGSFDLVSSQDSARVLIYNQLPYKKGDPERFALRVFDHEFNELWHKDIILPYTDDQFTVKEYRIDEQGDVYLLGLIYGNKTQSRQKEIPNYQYTVLAYHNQGEDFREYKIGLKDKFITDLTFRIDNDKNLVCSGFYSEAGTTSVKGTYFFRLNPNTQEVYDQNLKQLDFQFLTEYMNSSQRAKAEKAEKEGNAKKAPELYSFSLDELILRSDGGVVLVAEQYYFYTRSYNYWDGSYRYDNFYNYNDIIVVNIRPNGEIEWTARVPKQQETMNDGGYFSSYAMSILGDGLYFIYNDNPRNFNQSGKQSNIYNFNGKQSVIALTKIGRDGKVETYSLFRNAEADIITRPKICKQIGSRKMMVYGERGRNFKFASLEF